MQMTNIYTKKFSKILNLQKEEEISYYLVKYEEKQLYSIAIKTSNDDKLIILKNAWKSKDGVMKLIKFFYENSLKSEECEDIISDISCMIY